MCEKSKILDRTSGEGGGWFRKFGQTRTRGGRVVWKSEILRTKWMAPYSPSPCSPWSQSWFQCVQSLIQTPSPWSPDPNPYSVEHCCPLWNPLNVSDIQKVEDIQRYFTRRIAGFHNMNYWERLSSLKLLSPTQTRALYDNTCVETFEQTCSKRHKYGV